MDDNGERWRWVSVREAARLLGRSERSVRRWVAEGKLIVNRSGPVTVVDIGGQVPGVDVTTADVTGEVDRLQAGCDRLREVLASVTGERDRLREVVSDLRSERDRWQAAFEREQASLALSVRGVALLGERAGERPGRRWPWER